MKRTKTEISESTSFVKTEIQIDLNDIDIEELAKDKKPSPKLKEANKMLEKLKKNSNNDWFFKTPS